MKQNRKKRYEVVCEYCDGSVKERQVKREMFRIRDKFVILEDIPVGVCDRCGARYYHAAIVHRAHEIARDERIAEYKEVVPVGHVA
jgi:YgiT-type zinc finger domain-containing protein